MLFWFLALVCHPRIVRGPHMATLNNFWRHYWTPEHMQSPTLDFIRHNSKHVSASFRSLFELLQHR